MQLTRTISRLSFRAARTVAVLGLSLAAACGGDDGPAAPADQVAGTYTLRTVAGRQLPVTLVEEAGDKLELVSGALTLNTDGKFAGTMTFRITEDGRVTTETDGGGGTYTVSGGSVVLTAEDGERTTATRAGNSITFTDDGIPMVFTR